MLENYFDNNEVVNYRKNISLPKITDRDFWDSLDDEYKSMLIEEGERQQKIAWSLMLLSDFREFSITGNRTGFEDKSFMRRIKLSALVMAECVENKGRFLNDILDGIYLMLEESSWCLPAHNSHIRDAKQNNMPDVLNPVIDLFAAETGAVLGCAEYIMRPVLEKISFDVEKHVNAVIKDRLLTPYLSEHFWWMGDEETEAINWTVWITQNILLSLFTRNEEFMTTAEKESVLLQVVRSTDYFIKSYGDDGCCDEGAQYYSHAGLCLFGIIELINDLGNGRFNNVFLEEKIRNIASYIRKIYIGDGYYINYADCAAKAGHRTAREFIFGKRTEDEKLCAFAARDYKDQTADDRLLKEEHNLWYRILQASSHAEMMAYEDAVPSEEGDVYFESVGLFVFRNKDFAFAVKAGDNDDSHNHNDVGSVTLYKNNKPFLIDLGVETYSKKTFSENRYEIWTMRSLYHNIPSFVGEDGEIEEKPGKEFKATNVSFDKDTHTMSMNIEGAFGNAGIISYRRKCQLNGKEVLIEDDYDGEVQGNLNFMTYEKPEIVSSSIDETVFRIGDIGTMTVSGTGRLGGENDLIERCPITDERLRGSWKHDCFRIRIPFTKGELKVSMK